MNISGSFDSICRQHCYVLPNEILTSVYLLLSRHPPVLVKGTEFSLTVCQV